MSPLRVTLVVAVLLLCSFCHCAVLGDSSGSYRVAQNEGAAYFVIDKDVYHFNGYLGYESRGLYFSGKLTVDDYGVQITELITNEDLRSPATIFLHKAARLVRQAPESYRV